MDTRRKENVTRNTKRPANYSIGNDKDGTLPIADTKSQTCQRLVRARLERVHGALRPAYIRRKHQSDNTLVEGREVARPPREQSTKTNAFQPLKVLGREPEIEAFVSWGYQFDMHVHRKSKDFQQAKRQDSWNKRRA
eukprot:5661594-Amphidinium_carterae.1